MVHRRNAWLAAMAGAALVFLLCPQMQFGPDAFEQMHEGMSYAEVEAILGCPPGDYRPAIWRERDWHSDIINIPSEGRGRSLEELERQAVAGIGDWLKAGGPEPQLRFYRFRWWGRRYGIETAFDPSGRLIGWQHLTMLRSRPPLQWWRTPRWWLGV
jgi:hypothetical protein